MTLAKNIRTERDDFAFECLGRPAPVFNYRGHSKNWDAPNLSVFNGAGRRFAHSS